MFPWSKKPKEDDKREEKKDNEEKTEDLEDLEDLEEDEEKIEELEENEEKDFLELIGKPICELGGKYNINIHLILSKELLIIKDLHYNRRLNQDHIEEIKKGIMEDKCIADPIKIARDSYGNIRILDGHHRKNAIFKIDKESKGNEYVKVLISIYTVKDIDDEDTFTLYQKVNNIIKVDDKDLPQIIIIDGIKLIQLIFPKMIREKKKDRVNRPYIDHAVLYDRIRRSKIVEDYKLKANDLKNIILKVNDELSKKKLLYFKVTEIMYKTAKENKCYLGLKLNKNKEYEWLDSLIDYTKKYKGKD